MDVRINHVGNNTQYFSATGIYKIEGCNVSAPGCNLVQITNYDGVIINYDGYFVSANYMTAVNYINSGKPIVYAIDGAPNDHRTTPLKTLMANLFSGMVESNILISGTKTLESAIFTNSDNSVTKGPFGNLAGKILLPDASGNFGVKLLTPHPDFISVAETSDGYSRVFMHRTKAFFVVCDGGGLTVGTIVANEGTSDPTLKILLPNLIAWMADFKEN